MNEKEDKIKFEIKGFELIQREPEYLDKKMTKLYIEVPEHWETGSVALVLLSY